MERGKALVLIGFMGAGKSAAGRRVAQETGWQRFDTDEMIVRRFGMSVDAIFAAHGESAFRDAETDALRTIDAGTHCVVVTGGGIVLRKDNVELLCQIGLIIWLTADAETLFARVSRRKNRPLLQTPDPRATLARLLREREALYRAAADITIDTSTMSHGEVAAEILTQLRK